MHASRLAEAPNRESVKYLSFLSFWMWKISILDGYGVSSFLLYVPRGTSGLSSFFSSLSKKEQFFIYYLIEIRKVHETCSLEKE